MKVCSKCSVTKPLSEFSKQAGNSSGHRPRCKVCTAEDDLAYHRAYREANRERINTKHRAYREANRERINARRRARRAANPEKYKSAELRHKFGITLAEYDELLENQGGGCAICGKTPGENGRRLAVDHDHKTGGVRGLLCGTCNQGIGLLRDDSETCRQAMLYLRGYGE